MTQNNTAEQTMTVAEARTVNWHRQNPRPIGELLDEGYLGKSSLEWASQSAFNPRLKTAAQVLLKELNRAPAKSPNETPVVALPPELMNAEFSIDLTMEQVRATEWPFPPYKGHPMGELVDQQQITLKDLGYAAESAWKNRVRHAAVALFLTRLKHNVSTPDQAGMLHVFSGGRSLAQQRESMLVLAYGALAGALIGGAFVWLIMRLSDEAVWHPKPLPPNLANSSSLLIGVIGVLVIFILTWSTGIFLTKWLTNQWEKQVRLSRRGQEGEDRVVAAMHSALDGNWYLFRNITLPGRNKADLDSVLVGPSGVWVFEVKTFTGEYRNIGEHWEYKAGRRWRLVKKSPSRQASDNAKRLWGFFSADGIEQRVREVVIWANPETPLEVENPTVPVWKLDRLRDELGNIWQDESLPEAKRQQIVAKLTKLCKPQEDAAAASR